MWGAIVENRSTEWFDHLDQNMQQFVIGMLPKLVERLCAAGRRALDAGDHEVAGNAFERAKIVGPEKWEPRWGLALVASQRQDWDLTAYRLKEAIERGFRDERRLVEEELLARFRKRTQFEEILSVLRESTR